MTMRVLMNQTRQGDAGAQLLAGTTYTVTKALGAQLVGAGYAQDLELALQPGRNWDVTASADGGLMLKSVATRQGTQLLQYDALYKWRGSAQGGAQFNKTTGLSTALYSITAKMEVEAPFSAAGLLFSNIAANALTGNKALIGSTETMATSTSALLSQPTVGGTSYPVIAGGTTLNGFRTLTDDGATTWPVAAGSSSQQFTASDMVGVTPFARADGGSRPIFLWRVVRDGAAGGNWVIHQAPPAVRVPTTPMRGRTIVTSEAVVDAIATPEATMVLGSGTFYGAYPIIRHTVPVLSVWGLGDSIMQQDGLVADTISCYGYRACLDVSTPALPVVFANFGASSSTAPNYIATARNAYRAGAPGPGVLIVESTTINGLGPTPNLRNVENLRKEMFDTIDLAVEMGTPVVIWVPMCPYDVLDATGDGYRKAINAEAKAIAQQYGIVWVDSFSVFGDGATPERWVSTYRYESAGSGLHPNEVAVDTVMVPAISAILRRLIA